MGLGQAGEHGSTLENGEEGEEGKEESELAEVYVGPLRLLRERQGDRENIQNTG